uniref:Uncharacterized protein n=1 Tax=Glossina pallidipes TaxID=7398 RepID=A0A1A9ZIP8_GLOPL
MNKFDLKAIQKRSNFFNYLKKAFVFHISLRRSLMVLNSFLFKTWLIVRVPATASFSSCINRDIVASKGFSVSLTKVKLFDEFIVILSSSRSSLLSPSSASPLPNLPMPTVVVSDASNSADVPTDVSVSVLSSTTSVDIVSSSLRSSSLSSIEFFRPSATKVICVVSDDVEEAAASRLCMHFSNAIFKDLRLLIRFDCLCALITTAAAAVAAASY